MSVVYLEEGKGGGATQTAILDRVLIGQVFKPFHCEVSGFRGLSGAEVREITCQEDDGE